MCFSLFYRFGGQFIIAWLLKQSTAPQVIPNGTIYHKAVDITVIDSLNFLSIVCQNDFGMLWTHGIKERVLPHLFNVREN